MYNMILKKLFVEYDEPNCLDLLNNIFINTNFKQYSWSEIERVNKKFFKFHFCRVKNEIFYPYSKESVIYLNYLNRKFLFANTDGTYLINIADNEFQSFLNKFNINETKLERLIYERLL